MKWLPLFALLLMGCPPPHPVSQTRPTRIVRVVVEDGRDMTGWLPWQHKALLKLWPRLDATGYAFVLDARNPDVRVRSYNAGTYCPHGGGEYEPGRPFVWVDPACAHTAEELRFIVGHELLHWLTWRDSQWVGHLCLRGTDASDCHPRVHGVGMFSPFMPDSLEEDTARSVDAHMTAADIELLRVLRSNGVTLPQR